jgi:hypothetical protein
MQFQIKSHQKIPYSHISQQHPNHTLDVKNYYFIDYLKSKTREKRFSAISHEIFIKQQTT